MEYAEEIKTKNRKWNEWVKLRHRKNEAAIWIVWYDDLENNERKQLQNKNSKWTLWRMCEHKMGFFPAKSVHTCTEHSPTLTATFRHFVHRVFVFWTFFWTAHVWSAHQFHVIDIYVDIRSNNDIENSDENKKTLKEREKERTVNIELRTKMFQYFMNNAKMKLTNFSLSYCCLIYLES